jgi:putative Mg2+ transporter-C (MgtC) family protein
MALDIDFAQVIQHLSLMAITLLLAMPIAINREHKAHGAGLRTFPLVAIASCAFMLVGMSVYEGSEAEARVMYGIITGMGFIGGGSIIKTDSGASGTATAAGIWLTGAIGLSVAYQKYEIAIALSIVGYLVFQLSGYLKKSAKK